MPTERLVDRTHLGPDHRAVGDVPLPGTEDLTPWSHRTDWHTEQCDPAGCACWADGELVVVDLDRLPPTVPPAAPAAIDGLEVVTPALRPGLL